MKNVLNDLKIQWKQVDTDHVEVVFIGHFDENYAEAEARLNKAGLHAVKRKYDKKRNATTTIYKRARNVR